MAEIIGIRETGIRVHVKLGVGMVSNEGDDKVV